MEELRRTEQYREWVNLQGTPLKDRAAGAAVAQYKDCDNCPLLASCADETARIKMCTTDCPYDELPTGPSLRFLEANEWMTLPTEAVSRFIDELTYQQMQDIQTMRDYKESRMMGAKLFG